MITVVHDLGARRTYNKIGVGEYAWQQHCYAIGDTKPRYPMPTTTKYIEPLCCFCGSISSQCNRFPQVCFDDEHRHWVLFHSMD